MMNQTDNRRQIIARISLLGVAANALMAIVKIGIGMMASSIAIVSEGVNNGSDALTSILTFIGAKLAGKHPDAKHPFGYGRFEYLTSLVISILILVSGIEMLISSVKLIFHPEELSISHLALIIVAVSAIIKFFLGIYTIKMGRKVDSGALEGVGIECRNDSFASVITIIASLIFLFTGFSIDAYAGVIISTLIIKSGIDILKETVSELLGRPGERELAQKIYHLIRTTPQIIGAADMMLHNYGPGNWSGSVNVELSHTMTVGEVYNILHSLQLKIMHEENVTMVFGVYAVDNDHEFVHLIRQEVANFVRNNENVKSFHAVYIEQDTQRIYCDLIVDYKLKDWENLRQKFLDYMSQRHPQNEVILTIETEFV